LSFIDGLVKDGASLLIALPIFSNMMLASLMETLNLSEVQELAHNEGMCLLFVISVAIIT